MEDGKPMQMVKGKNQVTGFSLYLINIDTKDILKMEKDLDMAQ